MKTCAYCGSELSLIKPYEFYYCSYCELELSERYVLSNGERLSLSLDSLPSEDKMFLSTKHLLELETLHLICLLRYARQYRTDIYNIRILTHKANEKEENEEIDKIQQQAYKDYENATRKVWALENIIKDRIGYYPEKINDEFLALYNEKIKRSEKKKMVIKKTAKNLK